VDVDGALEFERNGVACARVEAAGRTVNVHLRDAAAALAAVRDFRGAVGAARPALGRAAPALAAADVAVQVCIGGRRVARAGAGARSGPLEKLLGLRAIEVHTLAVLLALIGR